VTVCAKERRALLANVTMHRLFVASWHTADAWRVGRYVVMPEHVHLFCSPAAIEAPNVKKWAGYWKGTISRAVKGCGPLAHLWTGAGGTAPSRLDTGAGGSASTPTVPDVGGAGGTAPSQLGVEAGGSGYTPTGIVPDPLWQTDCWDTQLRDARHYDEKWEYVRANPVRRGLAPTPEAWPYQGCLNELRW
jgi:REP element-mobilizing transposase RayT